MKKFEGVTGDSDMQPLPMSEEEYKAMAYERYNCIDERSGSISSIITPAFAEQFNKLQAQLQAQEGGTKHDNGKPDLSLLPSVFVKEVARALMYGENKYGRYNFEKGFDTHRLVGACLRHVYAWNEGEDSDPESGISHLAHAAASLGMLLRCLELGTATDTRSKSRG